MLATKAILALAIGAGVAAAADKPAKHAPAAAPASKNTPATSTKIPTGVKLNDADAKPFMLDSHSYNGLRSDDQFGYLFTHFTSTDEQVYWHLSDGDDPLNFSPLNHAKPILRNNLGSKAARDSFICKNEFTGKTYLIANNQSLISPPQDYQAAYIQNYTGIVVFEAKNDLLTEWSAPHLLPVAPKDSLHVFAPECISDPAKKQVLIHWSGATARDQTQRIYGAYTTDFHSADKPFLYFTDGPNGVGDMTLFKLNFAKDNAKNSSYARFYRSDADKYAVRGQISDNGLFGAWRDILPLNKSDPVTIDPNTNNQGPLVYKTHRKDQDEFLIWVKDAGDGYEAYETENIRMLPYTRKTAPYFPQNFEQGQVIGLCRKQYDAIKAKFYNSGRRRRGIRLDELVGLADVA